MKFKVLKSFFHKGKSYEAGKTAEFDASYKRPKWNPYLQEIAETKIDAEEVVKTKRSRKAD